MAHSITLPLTLKYDPDERIKGWPSFYSFIPDFMSGLNNNFYTMYRGRLYRHHANASNYNNYYGTDVVSRVETVFNEGPIENKLFKTIAFQGAEDSSSAATSHAAWDTTLTTDIEIEGTINYSWFEQKEGVWFAFIRTSDTVDNSGSDTGFPNYNLRSVNGIGNSVTVDTTAPAAVQINYPAGVKINGIINIGDKLYFGTPAVPPAPMAAPTFCGFVTAINVNPQAGINQLVVDSSSAAATLPTGNVLYYLYLKNSVAEAHGILGAYARVTLTNDSTNAIQLFAVQSDVMKSFP